MRPIHPTNVADARPRWESFTAGGQDFLRTSLADPSNAVAVFAVARTIAGRYRVEGVLSIGEATVLLAAHDVRLGRPVVVKALRNDIAPSGPAAMGDTDALTGAARHARHVLQTERRLLVRLRNAGAHAIPAPIDYVYDRNPVLAEVGGLDPFLAASEPYLVLPYLTGRTLEVALATEYPSGMDWRRALSLILPVVQAIEVLHRPWRHPSGRTWHCVYQDLKPANLMVAPHGPLSLIDFGGCQVVVDGVPVLEGSCTPGYAPPECDEGPARVLLGCADVFTIGSTLHHMLTGNDPRDRLTRRGARRGDPFELDPLPTQTPPELRRLLARCLAPRPSDRPADAGRVVAAIEALLAG